MLNFLVPEEEDQQPQNDDDAPEQSEQEGEQQQEEQEETIEDRISSIRLANRVCADCPRPKPQWAVFLRMQPPHIEEGRLGILVCRRCARSHYGTHYKYPPLIKFTHNVHEWDLPDVEAMEISGGNAFVNTYLEANYIGDKNLVVDDPRVEEKRRKKFIKRKYHKLQYCEDREEFLDTLLEKRQQIKDTKLLMRCWQQEQDASERSQEDYPLTNLVRAVSAPAAPPSASTVAARKNLQQIVEKSCRHLILTNNETVMKHKQQLNKLRRKNKLPRGPSPPPPPSRTQSAPHGNNNNNNAVDGDESVTDFLWKSTVNMFFGEEEETQQVNDDTTTNEDDTIATTDDTAFRMSSHGLLLSGWSERSSGATGTLSLSGWSERSTDSTLGMNSERSVLSVEAQLLQKSNNFDDLIRNYMKVMDGDDISTIPNSNNNNSNLMLGEEETIITCSVTSHLTTECIPEGEEQEEEQDATQEQLDQRQQPRVVVPTRKKRESSLTASTVSQTSTSSSSNMGYDDLLGRSYDLFQSVTM